LVVELVAAIVEVALAGVDRRIRGLIELGIGTVTIPLSSEIFSQESGISR